MALASIFSDSHGQFKSLAQKFKQFFGRSKSYAGIRINFLHPAFKNTVGGSSLISKSHYKGESQGDGSFRLKLRSQGGEANAASPPALTLYSLQPIVADKPLSSRTNPASRRTRWSCDSNQE